MADDGTKAGRQATGGIRRWFDDTSITAYGAWVIRWRWIVVALTFVIAAAAVMGGKNLGFSTDYRVFFSEDNPQLQAFEAIQRTYTQDDNILIVLKPSDGDMFTPERLAALRVLTDDAWQIPFTTRVDSPANFQHSFAEGDDLTVTDLVAKGVVPSPAEATEIRRLALIEPLLKDLLVSPDGTTVGVSVTLTMPRESQNEVLEAMGHTRGLVEAFRAENPDITVAVTGLAALNHAFSEASFRDISTLIPIMYGVLLVTMLVLLRSFAGTLATLLVIGLSAGTAMGLAGWAGIQLTPPSATAPTIILTIAIADSIHVLVTLFSEMRRGASKREALLESLRINFHPIFLTSLTTVIGFLSLNFSDAPPFRDLGNITAIGVTVAWIYSILFLPALVAILPLRVKPRTTTGASIMERFADLVIARRRLLLGAMLGTVVVLGALVPRIELNDQFVEYFDRSIQFRTDTDFAMDNLSGIYQAQWSLPAADSGGISDPAYLAGVERFADWLRAQPGVVHVRSLTDIFRRLNKNMHADDPAWYRLPDERDLAAQYLLLFEMSLPYGLDLNNQINVDKSAMRIIATLENITTNELRQLDAASSAWLRDNHPSAGATPASGAFVMFAYIAKRNIEGMLVGTLVAFCLISASLALFLRSIKLGVISLVPNLVPAVMAFGVWSLLVGEIGLASSVVTATSLGIIVDATVHFLSKYQRGLRRTGATAADAVRYAFSTVGTALWVTSAILIAGFAVLSLSTFEINASLGLLTAITLAMALLADFLLLPSLLMALERFGKKPRNQGVEDESAVTQAAE